MMISFTQARFVVQLMRPLVCQLLLLAAVMAMLMDQGSVSLIVEWGCMEKPLIALAGSSLIRDAILAMLIATSALAEHPMSVSPARKAFISIETGAIHGDQCKLMVLAMLRPLQEEVARSLKPYMWRTIKTRIQLMFNPLLDSRLGPRIMLSIFSRML